MLAQRISTDSPVLVKHRNFEAQGEAVIAAVQRALYGGHSHEAARVAVSNAFSGAVMHGQPAPTKWESFGCAALAVIDASEAAGDQDHRVVLWQTAKQYLTWLLDGIKAEEAKRLKDRNLYITPEQAKDTDYLISAMGDALANTTELHFT